MTGKIKRERRLFSNLKLVYLFAIYVIATELGLAVSKFGEAEMITINAHSVLRSFIRCVVYYIAMLTFSRFNWGVLVIPLVVWGRGFFYSIAVSVFINSGLWDLRDVFRLCLPAVIYLTGLLYLATLCFSLSVCRLRNHHLSGANISELRKGILYAGGCTLVGVLIEILLKNA